MEATTLGSGFRMASGVKEGLKFEGIELRAYGDIRLLKFRA